MTGAPGLLRAAPRRLSARACVALLLALSIPAQFLAPPHWGALCSAAAVSVALVILARSWRAEDRRAARGPKRCAGCGRDVEPQRHMTGATQAAVIVVPIGIMLYGMSSTLVKNIGHVVWDVPMEFNWPLVFSIAAAAAIPATVYMAVPKSCPVCRTRM